MKKSVTSTPSLSSLFPKMPTGRILKQVKEEHISLLVRYLEVITRTIHVVKGTLSDAYLKACTALFIDSVPTFLQE